MGGKGEWGEGFPGFPFSSQHSGPLERAYPTPRFHKVPLCSVQVTHPGWLVHLLGERLQAAGPSSL